MSKKLTNELNKITQMPNFTNYTIYTKIDHKLIKTITLLPDNAETHESYMHLTLVHAHQLLASRKIGHVLMQ